MLQAEGLAVLVKLMRQRLPELDVICFTGYTLSELQLNPVSEGVETLLSQADVLIDGPYSASLDDGVGLRGSSNQQVHHLTYRLSGYDLENCPRVQEIQVQGSDLLVVGLPTTKSMQALDNAISNR